MPRIILQVLLLLLVAGPAVAVTAPTTGPAAGPARVVELGSETYRGVVATARLQIPQQSGESGSGAGVSCVLLISFASAASGQPLTEGDVAVKLGEVAGRLGRPLRLAPGDGGFSAVVTISRGAEWLLKIGSRLDDGKKRIYRFYAQL